MSGLAAAASPPAASVRETLRVGGLVPFTTTDYPGRLAAVVFCQGCPWRCGYCHNPHLLPSTADRLAPTWSETVRFLDTRRGLLDAVVLSGGEPTAQESVVEASAELRSMGFAVALHTAGIYPRRLERVLSLVDWVGIDVKAPSSAYASITGVARSGVPAFDSLDLVCASGVAYEVRTTVHPQLLPFPQLEALARSLAARGVTRWVLQPFRPIGCSSAALNAAAPRGAILDPAWLEALRRHVPGVTVRA